MSDINPGINKRNKYEKIRLWVAFLPVSPLIVMVMSYIRWAKLGKLGFNNDWIKTTFLILINGFLAMIVLFAPLFFFILYVNIRSVSLVLSYMYVVFTLVSFVTREVEYKRVKEVLDDEENNKNK